MRRPIDLPPLARLVAILILSSLVSTPCAFAQAGPARSPSGGNTQANQLPLSGRNGQGGSVAVTQLPVPGTATSVNTINPTIQVQGPFAGSTLSRPGTPFSGRLSLGEEIQRAIEYNLGAVGFTQAVRQAHGQNKVARSALLPNLSANLSETVEQLNLKASGLRFSSPVPAFSVPSIVGPFNFFDLRATLSQTVLDLTAWNNYRSARDASRASELAAEDARDLVVLAVGGAYLQVIAAKAKMDSARAQLETATTLYQQTAQQRSVGVRHEVA